MTTAISVPTPLSPTAFKALSRKEQRQAIAHDALARLECGQLTPSHRDGYVAFGGLNTSRQDAQALLNKGTDCNACALGGAACALIAIHDKVQTRYGGAVSLGNRLLEGSSDCLLVTGQMVTLTKQLRAILGARQMELIEIAFEGSLSRGFRKRVATKREKAAAVRFAQRHIGAEARFKAIWGQIAARGRFNPSAR